MLMLLLPFALAAALLALVSRGAEWRRGILLSLVLGAACAWALTEGMSVFGALRRGPLAVGWGLALATALVAVRWRGLGARFAWSGRPWPDVLLLACALLATVYAAGTAFLSAVIGAPNTTDVLTYHMPRVIYWLQNGSVEFFPSNYYQQLSLQPMAEYLMAHTFALSGGDRFVQLVQWTSFLGVIVGVSLLVRLLGGGFRAQTAAAWLAAMTPNGFLQAGGSKNDLTMGFFLVAAACFLIDAARSRKTTDAIAAGAAVGFAFLTKGTAYLFAPTLGAGLLLGLQSPERLRLLRAAPVIAFTALALNAPHYARNYAYNGHPLGDGTADGSGLYPYANARFDAESLGSNVLRNAALQLAVTPGQTTALFETIIDWHKRLGIDPHDPATSFNSEPFRTLHILAHPTNELLAPNPIHTVLLLPLAVWLVWRRRLDLAAGLTIGLGLAFLAFCGYLKWQPWHARMHTPLTLLTCAPLGMLLARPRAPWIAFAILLGATWYAAPIALQNESRPLIGPRSVFRIDRYEQYFLEAPGRATEQRLAALYALRNGCRRIAIDAQRDFVQYPELIALLQFAPSARLRLTSVHNPSNRYNPEGQFHGDPCAVVCLGCASDPGVRQQYAEYGAPAELDDVLVFLSPDRNPTARTRHLPRR